MDNPPGPAPAAAPPAIEKLPPEPADFDLNGIWTFSGQELQLDDELALLQGHSIGNTPGTQKAAPHGTYTRKRYYRVVASRRNYEGLPPAPANFLLDIFDENGELGHFVWTPALGAWVGDQTKLTLSARATNEFCETGTGVERFTALHLVSFRENDFPRNGTKSLRIPCPLPRRWPQDRYPLPQQFIRFDRFTHNLEWTQPARGRLPDLALVLEKTDPRRPEPLEPGRPQLNETWGDVFKKQTVPQVTLPFLGYDPRRMDPDKPVATSGTDEAYSPDSNPGETFCGTPVFAYPHQHSMDCVCTNLPHSPWVPLGMWARYCPTEISETHTEIISSNAEQTRSWSATVGFSGGLKKMLAVNLEGSNKQAIQQQQERELRYSVTRRLHTKHMLFTYIPALKPHPGFIAEIQSQLERLFQNKRDSSKLNWVHFTNKFGTHYAHAVTCGSLEFIKTAFSSDAQTMAVKTGVKVKASAEGMIDKAKIGASVNWEQEWETKCHLKVSKQDVKSFAFGSDNEPMAIFLDLRPISELLSPLFFPYVACDKASELETVAPFIWYDLRASLERFLHEKGLDQSLPSSSETICGPRFFKITFPEFRVQYPNQPAWQGGIKFEGTNGVCLLGADVQPINSLGAAPEKTTFKIFATRKAIEAGGGLKMQLEMRSLFQGGPGIPNVKISRDSMLKDAFGRKGCLFPPTQLREQRDQFTLNWLARVEEYFPFGEE